MSKIEYLNSNNFYFYFIIAEINFIKINRHPYLLFLLIVTGSLLVAYDTIII